jgi:hypothetical protein
MAVKDFYEWCQENNINLTAESCHGPKSPTRGMKKAKGSDMIDGPRNGKDDLSGDYKGHVAMNGTVEPYKVVAKGKGGKAVAPVAG